ncbi:hypothetical protein BNJ_00439 [Kaumoebavirus]|uniref:hypothetical protein n=1 Tax=Kaumoebavirus TaxID=1859492 RepID=UPI0009C26FEA|nr:hypothetical protein BNJ_00439 [Kaumoebavirus]ARA72251.1 hypothetical protein BNJ_00439 [Kaumoebavirus]
MYLLGFGRAIVHGSPVRARKVVDPEITETLDEILPPEMVDEILEYYLATSKKRAEKLWTSLRWIPIQDRMLMATRRSDKRLKEMKKSSGMGQ